MPDRLQFPERYRQLTDDELARIALSGGLIPEAQEALTAELQRRGLSDLGEFKRDLEASAAASSLESQMRYQAQMKQKVTEFMLVGMAWFLAVALPFTCGSSRHPVDADLLKVCLIEGAFIAFSCYLGIRARRQGSRRGYALKLVVPLSLLGISTVVVLSLDALGIRF